MTTRRTYRSNSTLPAERELLWLETDVICIACLNKWCAVRPVGTDFNRLECPECGGIHSEQEHEYNAERVLQ